MNNRTFELCHNKCNVIQIKKTFSLTLGASDVLACAPHIAFVSFHHDRARTADISAHYIILGGNGHCGSRRK